MTLEIKPRQWWLVRHAPVTSGKIYGHLDLPADFSDMVRIRELASSLSRDSVVISSDLARCRETAQHILMLQNTPDKPVQELSSLREQNFGMWEGKSHKEVEVSDPVYYEKFWQNPSMNKPESGESFFELVLRVRAEVKTLQGMSDERDIVMVTHAGVIRAVVGIALGITPEKMLALTVAPLSLTHLTSFSDGQVTNWQVNFLNDLGSARRLES
ncbi:MAG: histidine phosphatase family protein [Sneathiella sp.]